MLKARNPHVNDLRVVFDEEPHIYYVDGHPVKSSVTTFLSEYAPKFDSARISKEQFEKHFNTVGHKYYQMSVEDIQKQWRNNEASSLGTKLHKAIEHYYNEEFELIDENVKSTIEWTYFETFAKNNNKLVPYRTEWEIYDKQLNLAGSIDIVYKNSDGTYDIGDWKRSKEIKVLNNFKNESRLFPPLEHLHNANYWKYSLQLNMYKYILETNYGVKIKNMHLYVFHGNNNNYVHYGCPVLSEEIASIVNERKKLLNNT